jgi:DegV family protein with EDD domain
VAQRVAVVTDSTAYLPPELIAELGIRVVPLKVSLGSRTGSEGIDVSSAQLIAALNDKVSVSTSRPAPVELSTAYRAAMKAGAKRIVSVHLSAELSGTWDSARLAAQDFDYGTVRVVDSRSTAMGLGFAVLAAARAAAAGADVTAVASAAVDAADATTSLIYVDSLEYLRRGGRIGAAATLLGTALSVKPLLHIRQGRIVPLEKVRTSAKAMSRLLQLSVDAAGSHDVDIAVQHLGAAEKAAELAGQLRAAIPKIGSFYVSELGAVVGAHTGPGVLGVVVSRR